MFTIDHRTVPLPRKFTSTPIRPSRSEIGLINTHLGLVIAYTTFSLPFALWLLIAYFETIPHEIDEAARVDGATRMQIALRIKLPLARPAIVLTTVFTIIGSLQLFAEPLVLRSLTNSIGFDYTPNVAAYTEAFQNNNQSLAAAEAVLLALVSFVLSFGFLRAVRRWQHV